MLITKPIDIVLATYNGQTYLEEQLNSIVTNCEFDSLINQIIIIDDDSTDNTFHLISNFQRLHAHKITVIQNTENLGASKTFTKGIEMTTAPFVMLSDQDDIWNSMKILKSYREILKLEEKNSQVANLVFSDKEVVDDTLNTISMSYFALKKLPLDWHTKFSHLVQQNCVSGCTMLFNRKLLNIASPISPHAYMHDWWLTLFAAEYGQIHLIKEPLVKYRQHLNNEIGAEKQSFKRYLGNLTVYRTRFNLSMDRVIKQAQAYQAHSNNENCSLKALADLHQNTTCKNLKHFLLGHIKRSNVLAQVALLGYILSRSNR